jgi:acyl dehydratase
VSTFTELSPGDAFRTPSLTISEETAKRLIATGGYTHPLFTDDAYAKASPFGRAPLPGQAVLLLMGGLVEQSNRFDETTIALLGFEDVRFRKPAFPGDTIAVEVTVLEKEPRGAILFAWTCVNEKGAQLVEARARMLFRVAASERSGAPEEAASE